MPSEKGAEKHHLLYICCHIRNNTWVSKLPPHLLVTCKPVLYRTLPQFGLSRPVRVPFCRLFVYLFFFFTSHDSKTFHFWGDHELLLGTLLTGLRQMMTQMAQPVVIISRSTFDNVWRKRCGWKERWRGANGDNETSLSIGIESFHYCAVGHAYCGRCRYTPWNGGRVFFFILSSRAVLDACRPCDHWLTIFLLSGITLLRENLFLFFFSNQTLS